MKLMVAYGLIAFAIGTGISALAGRVFNVPWLFGQFHDSDPGMAISTALAVIALGVGMLLIYSVWRNGKPKTKEEV